MVPGADGFLETLQELDGGVGGGDAVADSVHNPPYSLPKTPHRIFFLARGRTRRFRLDRGWRWPARRVLIWTRGASEVLQDAVATEPRYEPDQRICPSCKNRSNPCRSSCFARGNVIRCHKPDCECPANHGDDEKCPPPRHTLRPESSDDEYRERQVNPSRKEEVIQHCVHVKRCSLTCEVMLPAAVTTTVWSMARRF